MDRGKYAAAERLLRELIDVSRRKYGDEDAHTLNHMGNLGVCLSHQTNHKDAEQIYRELRRVHARDSGADSPLTLQYTCYLAISIASLGRHEEGVQLLREVVQKNEKLPPKSDLALQDAQELLASALDTFAKADKTNPRAKDARAEALALRRVVHVALKRILGEDHPNTIKTGGDIAVSLKDMGLAAEALPLLRRALDSERRRSGHEHPRALTTAANLAAALADLSELDEAMQILNETVQISSRVLGANHPDTLRYVKWRSNVSETIRRGNRRPQNKFRDLVVSPSDRADAEARAAIAEAELMAMLDLDSDRAADGKKGEKKKKK
jgi:tetratricopeptide (TPR) repeat protein